MNTEYIECIEDIVIKNPQTCSITSDIKTIATYDSFELPPPKHFLSQMVTIKGWLNDGKEFQLKLPIDPRKTIQIDVGNPFLKEE